MRAIRRPGNKAQVYAAQFYRLQPSSIVLPVSSVTSIQLLHVDLNLTNVIPSGDLFEPSIDSRPFRQLIGHSAGPTRKKCMPVNGRRAKGAKTYITSVNHVDFWAIAFQKLVQQDQVEVLRKTSSRISTSTARSVISVILQAIA